jgi:hypothetical protein
LSCMVLFQLLQLDNLESLGRDKFEFCHFITKTSLFQS